MHVCTNFEHVVDNSLDGFECVVNRQTDIPLLHDSESLIRQSMAGLEKTVVPAEKYRLDE